MSLREVLFGASVATLVPTTLVGTTLATSFHFVETVLGTRLRANLRIPITRRPSGDVVLRGRSCMIHRKLHWSTSRRDISKTFHFIRNVVLTGQSQEAIIQALNRVFG